MVLLNFNFLLYVGWWRMGSSRAYGMDIKTLFKAYFVLESLFLKRYIWHESDGTIILTLGYSVVKYFKILSTKELEQLERTWDVGTDLVDWETRPLQRKRYIWLFEDIELTEDNQFKLIYRPNYRSDMKRTCCICKMITLYLSNLEKYHFFY